MRIGLQIIAFTGALLFLYAAAFLYEDEEGHIQNKLEEWWVKLSDKQTVVLSLHTRFMQQVASIATRMFDSLFGKKIVSLRAFVVSAWLSLGSALLVALVADSFTTDPPPSPLFIVPLFCLGAAILAAMSVWAARSLAVVLLIVLYLGLSFANVVADPTPLAEVALVILVGGFICDMSFIAVTRWALRWCRDMNSFARILSLVLLNALLAVVLCILPFGLYYPSFGVDIVSNEILAFGASNGLDLAVASVVFVLGLGLLAHRLFWPLVSRPLYAIATRTGVRQHLFAAVGMTLLTFATGKAPEAWAEILKSFG